MKKPKQTITRNQVINRLNAAIRRSKLPIHQLRAIIGLGFRLRTNNPTNFIDKLFLPDSINEIIQLIKIVESFEKN